MRPGKWAAGTSPKQIATAYGLPEDFYTEGRTQRAGAGGFQELSGEVHISDKYDPDGEVAPRRTLYPVPTSKG